MPTPAALSRLFAGLFVCLLTTSTSYVTNELEEHNMKTTTQDMIASTLT